MLDVVVVLLYTAAGVFAILGTVDAIKYDPWRWARAGYGARLRMLVIVAPVFLITCPPVGVGPALFYFIRVRPRLKFEERVARNGGQSIPHMRATLGLWAALREMTTGQIVKTALSAVLALALALTIIASPTPMDDDPLWLTMVGAVLLLPTLFLAFYIGLSLVQLLLPAMFRDSGQSATQRRFEQNAAREALRRRAAFGEQYGAPNRADLGIDGKTRSRRPPNG